MRIIIIVHLKATVWLLGSEPSITFHSGVPMSQNLAIMVISKCLRSYFLTIGGSGESAGGGDDGGDGFDDGGGGGVDCLVTVVVVMAVMLVVVMVVTVTMIAIVMLPPSAHSPLRPPHT